MPLQSDEELATDYYHRFAPATPEQRFQVDNLVRNESLLRRFHQVESQLWQYQASLCDRSSGVQLGEAFTKASTIFMRLQRRITAAEKAYKEAMAELKRLQAPAQPKETKAKTEQLASFLTPPQKPPTPGPILRKMIDSLRPELAIPKS